MPPRGVLVNIGGILRSGRSIGVNFSTLRAGFRTGNVIARQCGMFHTFQIPLTWFELAKRTVSEITEDDVLGLAAQLAYYFLFALAPAIVCIIALTSLLPFNVLQDLISSISGFAPPDVVQIIRDQLANINQGEHTGLLTFGLLVALWSSSAAMVSIIGALNRAYDIDEARPWWQVRLIAILLTIGAALFIVVAFALVMIGPTFIDRIATEVGLGPAFATVWQIIRFPIALALVALGIGLVFYFAPDAEQDWEWITPGAVLATVLWLLASLGFKFYVANFGSYNESYGSLGGVIILMLWFYISALAILVGAEMNAEIEHASPHGKDVGEKVPGVRKKIGCAAKRAWLAKAKERRERKASQVEEKNDAYAARRLAPAWRPLPRASLAAYAVLGLGLFKQLRKGSSPTRPAATR
jgi:membrane protein